MNAQVVTILSGVLLLGLLLVVGWTARRKR